MKSELKVKISVVISLGIIFALFPFIGSIFSRIIDYDTKYVLNDPNSKISASMGKIHIDNDWNGAKSIGICTGNGTFSEPYVIEDLVINGGGGGSCIFIENSNVYFRIENCTVYNSGENAVDAGIKLVNVGNGTLASNVVALCGNNGILIEYGSNNTMLGNIVDDNKFGITLKYSENSIVSENKANSNYYYGITLYHSNDIIISGNTANYNNYFGINVEYSFGIELLGNTIHYNNHFDWSCGIHLAASNENNLSGNTINHNRYGLYSMSSNNSIIRFNTIEENDIGIFLRDSYYIEISDNTFNGNNVNIQEYISPKSLYRDIIPIVFIIITLTFSGTVVITLLISRKRASKITEIRWPGLSRILAIISSILCLVGDFFYLWVVPDLPYFSPIGAMFFGILVIVGGFMGLRFQLSGSILCLISGLFSIACMYSSVPGPQSAQFLYGNIFVIIGSIVGLIGVYLIKRNKLLPKMIDEEYNI